MRKDADVAVREVAIRKQKFGKQVIYNFGCLEYNENDCRVCVRKAS